MTVLGEERIVLDGVTEATDFFGQIVGAIVHKVERLSDLTVLLIVVVELDRTRVNVVVLLFPGAQLGPECLVLIARKTQVLRSHNKVSLLEAESGVGSQKTKDGDSSHTPLACRLGALAHCDCHTSKTLLD